MENWYHRETVKVLRELLVDERRGLSTADAEKRLAAEGENAFQCGHKISPWRIFFSQFSDFMVLVLIGAAIVSALLGEQADAVTIVAIIVINAILGFIQEYRAEKSLEALKELTAPTAQVVRDGQIRKIPANHLVPGDIFVLEAGDRIAADGRLLETVNLEINEAPLTGESLVVLKDTSVIRVDRPALGDRRNMVFSGTSVSGGRGRAVVVATGMRTEIGKIARMIEEAPEEATPLQKRLTELGRWLVVICLGICAAVATLGILRGEPPRQMFMAAVSLAVAAIPEGLPAIVTIALALGVQRMIRRQVIIRKLPAVETLGCATIICSDKTGTLTQNRLAVTRFFSGRKMHSPPGGASGTIPADLRRLLEIGALCNNAHLEKNGTTGDPTEAALLAAAAQWGLSPEKLQQQMPRRGEVPFSSERKRMSVWVEQSGTGEELLLFVKGASDIILERCDRVLTEKGIVPLGSEWRREIVSRVEQWGAEALRVLAFAFRTSSLYEIPRPGSHGPDPEQGLVFVGLMGMTDPPRPETRQALETARRAGIRVKMITGDYPQTALAVAKQIQLLRPGGKMLTGPEMDHLSDEQLIDIIESVDVFARVSPHHKLRVVKALKKTGAVTAMTGDGVNDAPAVKEAHIGVAMGQSGADVTKEAAAMVIADDNFATIVAAVEEGRTIYENIRKFIRYLLSCNTGEILTIWGGIMLGLPFPLLPIQILWVNLVTDGLPAIALGMDPAPKGMMDRSPRSPREGIFSRGLGLKIIFQGLIIAGMVLTIYWLKLQGGTGLPEARTAAFTALVFAQLFFVFQCRSEERTLFQTNPFENKYLVGAVLVSSGMQVMVLILPFFQKLFYTTPLRFQDWLLIIGLTVLCATISETIWKTYRLLKKTYRFRRETHRGCSPVAE